MVLESNFLLFGYCFYWKKSHSSLSFHVVVHVVFTQCSNGDSYFTQVVIVGSWNEMWKIFSLVSCWLRLLRVKRSVFFFFYVFFFPSIPTVTTVPQARPWLCPHSVRFTRNKKKKKRKLKLLFFCFSLSFTIQALNLWFSVPKWIIDSDFLHSFGAQLQSTKIPDLTAI